MKKQTKKLVLAKETLRNLGVTALGKAAGGSYNNCLSYYCPSSNQPLACHQACPGDPPSADTLCA
jgi:hypothetical protein